MPFDSGRVTFARFRVVGKAPESVTPALLEKLGEHAFTDTPIGAPDEVESGFITGDHLFDVQFTYEKNGFGNLMLFALRMDTNKVPGEIRRAYQRINEAALASGNPSGHISRAQRKDARDSVDQQIHDDLASGKYRRSKIVPLLWDLQRQTLYCGAAGNAVVEQLVRKFKEAFGCELESLTSGSLAGQWLRDKGQMRDFEDLRPSPFTAPPPAATTDKEDASGPSDLSIPSCPWTASATDLKDFLGNEFALWLWWQMETAEGVIRIDVEGAKRDAAFTLMRALDMECAWGAGGKQSLKGDGPTQMAEATEALRLGKWPRKIALLLSDGEHQWELSLQAERLVVSSALLPAADDAQSPREVLETRLMLTRALAETLDGLYRVFIEQRCGATWPTHRQKITDWIKSRRKR